MLNRSHFSLITMIVTTLLMAVSTSAWAIDKNELNRTSKAALEKLTSQSAVAKELAQKATAILVFPSITKAGLVVGGQHGNGVLWQKGKPIGYYNTAGASYGMQAGAQKFGYAMFFMNQEALNSLSKSNGFEVGVGPSIVLIDEGMAKTHTTNTLQNDIYAFVFSQKGLMAGLGLQGNKITPLK